jgi:hypothetical protein
MLPNRLVGLCRDYALLRYTAPGFSVRVSWIGLSDPIPGLLPRASVCSIHSCWTFRLDAGRSDHKAKKIIVMAILVGLLPIMLSHGAGADVMRRIAAPMIGRVITSFLLEFTVGDLSRLDSAVFAAH